MNEDLTDEEQFSRMKRPSTGLARKYAQKQLKEENVLAKLLKVQSEKFGETIVEMKADGTPDVKPVKKSMSITEARNHALQSMQSNKKLDEDDSVTKEYYTLSLDEAVNMLTETALNENWKDNINNLSPGKQDTVKKLLMLADSIRNNTPQPDFTTVQPTTAAATQLYENAKLINQKYSLKEAMAMVHILQDSQKSVFLEEREAIIEKWSDVIAEALIDNKKHIISDPKGQILRVE